MQFSVRLAGDDEERLERLCAHFGIGKYQLAKRLLLIGLARVEGDADPLNPDSSTALERLLEGIERQLGEEFRASRARDFNLAADNLETMVWLRTLGDLLAPNSMSLVAKRVQFGRAKFLSTVEQLPPDAPVRPGR
jgi:hypothetical protein